MPKDNKIKSTHYIIIKISKKKVLQQIEINNSSDIDFKDFIKIYRKCTSEPLFFIIDTTFICEQFKN